MQWSGNTLLPGVGYSGVVLHVALTTPAATVNLVTAIHFCPAFGPRLRLVQRTQQGREYGADRASGPR
jgi:hypothetical protein